MTRSLAAALTLAALTSQNPAPPPPPTDCQETAAALTRLLNNDVRLRDWAQLARYREANRTLSAPKPGEARVVFMGDSITDNWQQDRFGGFFPGKSYVDRGISGQTTSQMLVRFRPDVIDLKPKAVVILAGTNDIAANTGPMTDEDVERNLTSMAELAKANGIKVVFASITPTSGYHPPASGVPQTTTRPMARIRAINDWIKKYTADNGHVYLDYFTPMLDATGVMKADLTGDDCHPNPAGYAIMRPVAEIAAADEEPHRRPGGHEIRRYVGRLGTTLLLTIRCSSWSPALLIYEAFRHDRRTFTGSTRAALRAGTIDAIAATASRTAATSAKLAASCGVTP